MTCGPFDKPLLRPLLSGAALVLVAALAGCASKAVNAQAGQTSPTVAHIAALDQTLGPYPRWKDFPRGPEATPPPAEIARRVAGLEQAQADLLHTAAGLTWTLSGTAAFAEAAHAQINPELATPPPPDQGAQIESLARSLREQATPPPKPQ
jgi:hypothetical protein